MYVIMRILIYYEKIPAEIWNNFKSWGLVAVIGVGGILGIARIIVKLTEDKEDKDSPKDFVDVKPAMELWKKEFLDNANIPCRYDKVGRNQFTPVPINPENLQMKHKIRYSVANTGNHFLLFEFKSKVGDYYGTNVCEVNLSNGKKYISNNWDENLTPKMTISNYLRDSKRYAIDTPQSEQMRLALKKIEAREEGATRSELRDYEDFKMRNTPTQQNLEVSPEFEEQQMISQELSNQERLNKLAKK